jgi:hypothetical protein
VVDSIGKEATTKRPSLMRRPFGRYTRKCVGVTV